MRKARRLTNEAAVPRGEHRQHESVSYRRPRAHLVVQKRPLRYACRP